MQLGMHQAVWPCKPLCLPLHMRHSAHLAEAGSMLRGADRQQGCLRGQQGLSRHRRSWCHSGNLPLLLWGCCGSVAQELPGTCHLLLCGWLGLLLLQPVQRHCILPRCREACSGLFCSCACCAHGAIRRRGPAILWRSASSSTPKGAARRASLPSVNGADDASRLCQKRRNRGGHLGRCIAGRHIGARAAGPGQQRRCIHPAERRRADSSTARPAVAAARAAASTSAAAAYASKGCLGHAGLWRVLLALTHGSHARHGGADVVWWFAASASQPVQAGLPKPLQSCCGLHQGCGAEHKMRVPSTHRSNGRLQAGNLQAQLLQSLPSAATALPGILPRWHYPPCCLRCPAVPVRAGPGWQMRSLRSCTLRPACVACHPADAQTEARVGTLHSKVWEHCSSRVLGKTQRVVADRSCPHLALADGLACCHISRCILLVCACQLLCKGMQHPEEGLGVCQRGLLGIDEAAQMPAA